MGYIKKLKENELIGGISDADVYPITASSAVYHNGASLDKVIDDIKEDMTPSSIVNKDAILEYGKKSTIAIVDNNTEITVTMPNGSKPDVVNKGAVLEFGTTKTIATIDSKDINVVVPSIVIENKDATVDYGVKTTICTINNNDITITIPEVTGPDSVFISVGNWNEFKREYNKYKETKTNVYLSFTGDITVSEAANLNLSNFTIYGHYHKWINNNTVTLEGTYAKFTDVNFVQGGSSRAALFKIYGYTGSGFKSCEFNFERCRFTDFFNTGRISLFKIKNDTMGGRHIVIDSCKFNNSEELENKELGEDSVIAFDLESSLENSKDGVAVSVCILNTLNTNRNIECYKIGTSIAGSEGKWYKDKFGVTHDNSMTFVGETPKNYRNISIARS